MLSHEHLVIDLVTITQNATKIRVVGTVVMKVTRRRSVQYMNRKSRKNISVLTVKMQVSQETVIQVIGTIVQHI